MTSELARRVWEHKVKAVPGFTARYGVDRLVWFETHDSAEAAMRREKQIKDWRRDWKINLIERDQPALDRPLSESIMMIVTFRAWAPAFAGETVWYPRVAKLVSNCVS